MNTRNALFADKKISNMGGWQDRHNAAVIAPVGFERPIVHLFESWLDYADRHKARYESSIGADGFLGEHWKDIGLALRGLLNGDCGRLDCGTLDAVVLNTLNDAGFDTEAL
jgi:hypothetical protein